MGVIKEKSGIDEHIKDFETFLYGKNSNTYRTNLIQDVINIIENKTKLGIFKELNFTDSYNKQDPKLILFSILIIIRKFMIFH